MLLINKWNAETLLPEKAFDMDKGLYAILMNETVFNSVRTPADSKCFLVNKVEKKMLDSSITFRNDYAKTNKILLHNMYVDWY